MFIWNEAQFTANNISQKGGKYHKHKIQKNSILYKKQPSFLKIYFIEV